MPNEEAMEMISKADYSPVFTAGEPPNQARYQEGEYIPIKPFGSRVLAIRNEFQQMGRIIIPDTSKQAPTTGRIVAIGPEVPEGHPVKLDMQVCFGRYDGKEQAVVDSEGTVRVYILLHVDELMGELVVSTDKLRFPKKDGTYE
jgi:co-chaperonin GroES (HSP10)